MKYIFYLTFILYCLCSCATPPKIGEQAVTTPEFRENRVLFADEHNDLSTRRDLLHSYELEPIAKREQINPLSPLACIIRGGRIPKSIIDRKRDIAVVLDVVTAGTENVTSLVAFYQRDVPGGQMLNFQDLLVYYNQEWDGITPPWFRVRILEVNAERNTRTQQFLDASNKLAGSLSGMIPHPVLPSVKTAIEASKLIFANKKNKVLIDYQVQFYSQAHRTGAQVNLTPLKKGEWLVVGREKEKDSNFWNHTFEIDHKTLELYKKGQGTPLQVPYVSLVLMSADATIPKHIMDRSLVFLELLDSSSERNNFRIIL
jgi:hypothetical protein